MPNALTGRTQWVVRFCRERPPWRSAGSAGTPRRAFPTEGDNNPIRLLCSGGSGVETWGQIFSPSRRTLRQFAGLWMLFFGGLAGWQGLVRGHWVAALVLAGLAVSVGALGLWKPRAVRP